MTVIDPVTTKTISTSAPTTPRNEKPRSKRRAQKEAIIAIMQQQSALAMSLLKQMKEPTEEDGDGVPHCPDTAAVLESMKQTIDKIERSTTGASVEPSLSIVTKDKTPILPGRRESSTIGGTSDLPPKEKSASPEQETLSPTLLVSSGDEENERRPHLSSKSTPPCKLDSPHKKSMELASLVVVEEGPHHFHQQSSPNATSRQKSPSHHHPATTKSPSSSGLRRVPILEIVALPTNPGGAPAGTDATTVSSITMVSDLSFTTSCSSNDLSEYRRISRVTRRTPRHPHDPTSAEAKEELEACVENLPDHQNQGDHIHHQNKDSSHASNMPRHPKTTRSPFEDQPASPTKKSSSPRKEKPAKEVKKRSSLRNLFQEAPIKSLLRGRSKRNLNKQRSLRDTTVSEEFNSNTDHAKVAESVELKPEAKSPSPGPDHEEDPGVRQRSSVKQSEGGGRRDQPNEAAAPSPAETKPMGSMGKNKHCVSAKSYTEFERMSSHTNKPERQQAPTTTRAKKNVPATKDASTWERMVTNNTDRYQTSDQLNISRYVCNAERIYRDNDKDRIL